MIVVLLLFFRSICLYCQRFVLHIYDRWVHPENVRLLKEAAETKKSKFRCENEKGGGQVKRVKRRRPTSDFNNSNGPSDGSESCRFCANTPQGYCRHHFHLKELQLHKQQQRQRTWCPLQAVDNSLEYRQLRKIKRELKCSLNNRFDAPHRPQLPSLEYGNLNSCQTASSSSTTLHDHLPVCNDSSATKDILSVRIPDTVSLSSHTPLPSLPPARRSALRTSEASCQYSSISTTYL